jgi:hypothetical protein
VKSEEFQRLEKQRLRSPKRHYYDHLKRVENDKKALVILLSQHIQLIAFRGLLSRVP